jgi:uracil-DNA glycosylase
VECSKLWHRSLFGRLPQLELVLAVGSYSQAWHLGSEAGPSLQATVLDGQQHLRQRRRPRVLPLPHPSWRNNGWLRRNPWFEEELLPVLRREVRKLL